MLIEKIKSKQKQNIFKVVAKLMYNPGLVVLGGDSCPEGCRFESRHRTYCLSGGQRNVQSPTASKGRRTVAQNVPIHLNL